MRASTGILTIDLPTEAQWEFACRAGTASTYSNGKGADCLDEIAWYTDNSDGRSHEVGRKDPNAFGLYDMHGNVFEMCRDWLSYGTTYSDGSAVTDPKGPDSRQETPTGRTLWRVMRGGGFGTSAGGCRSAYRNYKFNPYDYNSKKYFGYRLMCGADFSK